MLLINIHLPAGRPGGSVGKLVTFWCWDVSSNLGAVTRTAIFPRPKTNMPNKWKTINSWVHKIRLHGVDEGKGRLNPSRDKN